MTREELIRQVSLRTNYAKYVCDEIIKDMCEVMANELEAHGTVRLPQFGVFKVYDRKGRNYRHPVSGEIIEVESKKYTKFTPSDILLDRIQK